MTAVQPGGKSSEVSNLRRGGFESGAACALTRRGDRAMRMRFWGENTREWAGAVHQRLLARAFHPKARSHGPITTPKRY
jgi:hypothetical protein